MSTEQHTEAEFISDDQPAIDKVGRLLQGKQIGLFDIDTRFAELEEKIQIIIGVICKHNEDWSREIISKLEELQDVKL